MRCSCGAVLHGVYEAIASLALRVPGVHRAPGEGRESSVQYQLVGITLGRQDAWPSRGRQRDVRARAHEKGPGSRGLRKKTPVAGTLMCVLTSTYGTGVTGWPIQTGRVLGIHVKTVSWGDALLSRCLLHVSWSVAAICSRLLVLCFSLSAVLLFPSLGVARSSVLHSCVGCTGKITQL